MKVSLNKLEKFIRSRGLIIKKIFTVNNEAVYLELFNINNAETFMVYIPSKFTMKVNGRSNVYKIKYLELSDDEQDDTNNYEAEKDYDEIDLSPEKINSDELESKLKENYNKPITLNNLSKVDIENIKDVKDLGSFSSGSTIGSETGSETGSDSLENTINTLINMSESKI